MKSKENIIGMYQMALINLQHAERTLRSIYQTAKEQNEMQYFAGFDALEYADNVLEIITCDNGQAGLKNLIEKIS